jgi:hypothetical protein
MPTVKGRDDSDLLGNGTFKDGVTVTSISPVQAHYVQQQCNKKETKGYYLLILINIPPYFTDTFRLTSGCM